MSIAADALKVAITPMQARIVDDLIQGVRPGEIAKQLGIKRGCIYFQISSAVRHLNCRTSYQMVAKIAGSLDRE